MKKELYLLRHAKSDWSGIAVSDFDRGLNKRGMRDAPLIGDVLSKKGVLPKLVLSSPAKRAKKTASIICEKIGYSLETIVYEPLIYEASTNRLIDIISKVDDSVSNLMLVGHNPALTYLINYISDLNLDNLPTCSVVGISFEISSWQDFGTKKGDILFYEYPKRYL